MKILFIFMLLGYGSATLLESFKREAKSAVNAFANGLQVATPLHEALDIEDSPELQRIERDIKEELKQHIKEAFEKAMKRIEDAVEKGQKVNEEALKMLKDLREKMKELDIDDESVKAGTDELKNKVDEHLRQILEKMGITDKRSAEMDPFASVIGDLSIRNMLIKLKNMVLEKMNVGSIKEAMVKIVGQGSQKLCEWITNKGKEKVLNIFDHILESDEESEVDKRNSDDRMQEIRGYLENVEQEAEAKIVKFKDYYHELISAALDNAKENLEKVIEIIKEIITSRNISSEKYLSELLEYLRQYREEFSAISGLREMVKKILNETD